MSFISQITSGPTRKARRTLLFGVHGWGKSSWAAGWPAPLFFPIEDGISDIDCDAMPLLTSFGEIMRATEEVVVNAEYAPFKTLVFDTADWIERLIHKDIVDNTPGARSITDGKAKLSFGAGHNQAETKLGEFLRLLDQVRQFDIHVILLAHCTVSEFRPPDTDPYDRYVPKMHKGFSSIIEEWADENLFGFYKTHVVSKEEGFNKTRKIGVGNGDRIIKTTERPGWRAKNRLGLPDEMSLETLPPNPTREQMYDALAEYRGYLPDLRREQPVVDEPAEEATEQHVEMEAEDAELSYEADVPY